MDNAYFCGCRKGFGHDFLRCPMCACRRLFGTLASFDQSACPVHGGHRPVPSGDGPVPSGRMLGNRVNPGAPDYSDWQDQRIADAAYHGTL